MSFCLWIVQKDYFNKFVWNNLINDFNLFIVHKLFPVFYEYLKFIIWHLSCSPGIIVHTVFSVPELLQWIRITRCLVWITRSQILKSSSWIFCNITLKSKYFCVETGSLEGLWKANKKYIIWIKANPLTNSNQCFVIWSWSLSTYFLWARIPNLLWRQVSS